MTTDRTFHWLPLFHCVLLATAVLAHGADEHDEHDHAAHDAALPFEKRAATPCEHNVPISQCAECRYEVGVVRVDPCILGQADGAGLVATQTVVLARLPASLLAHGEVVLNGNRTAHIAAPVSGTVHAAPHDLGAPVNAGDELLTLRSIDLGRAQAEHTRNRALASLAEKVFARETKLREQGVGSEQDLIEAQVSLEERRAELAASEQMLQVLEMSPAEIAGARATLGLLPLRAPFAGTVLEKHAVPGELAEAGDDLVLFSDLSSLWIWASVHSRDLPRLLEAQRADPVDAEIAVAAYPDRRFRGAIDYIGATMDETTRTVKVRATIDNADGALRPGMFCETVLNLADANAPEAPCVPETAILTDEGSSFAFKHWKDDLYVRQPVRTGRAALGRIEVTEGLQVGDVVVAEGAFLLKSDVLREKMGAGCAD